MLRNVNYVGTTHPICQLFIGFAFSWIDWITNVGSVKKKGTLFPCQVLEH